MTPERWHKIEEIYQTVIELPPAERAGLLTQFCAEDTTLRREVEALLAEEETTDDFLQAPIKEVASTLQLRNEDELLGQDIGPYHLRRLLGQGGMGAVYLAERADAEYYQQVALKIVRRGLDSRFVLKRFRVERQILATLAHPNIAQLLDGGTTATGLPYFVMEYIEGQPLTEYCNERQLSINDRLHLFLPVCAAVQHAHQKLVVHRDLKPSNILVTPAQDGKDGVPKLLDFGIAKLLDPTLAPEDMTRTLTAMRLMTPDYASPEQVRGLPITTASDIYSLGAVLYELLTGVRPHRFETYTPAEIERVVCDTEIERPSSAIERLKDESGRLKENSRRGFSSLIPHPSSFSSLRGDLDNIVLMALRKEPERRYQSVEQLAEDIRRYLAGRPISARRESLVYRTEKFVRRNKLGVAATALIFFSLLGGIVTTARAARVAQRERARAEANLAEAQQQRSEAVKQRAEAEKQRAEADRQRNVAELERAEALAQSERASAKAIEAEAQRHLAETQRAEADRQRERAERRFGQVRKLANTFLFDFHDKIVSLPGSTAARELVVSTALEYLDSLAKEAEGDRSLQNELAVAYQRVGDVQGHPRQPSLARWVPAMESYQRSIALFEQIRAAGYGDVTLTRRLAQTYAKTGEVARFTNQPEIGKAAYEKARALAEQLLAADSKDEIGYHTLGLANEGLGNLANISEGNQTLAVSYLRRALAIIERWAKEMPSPRSLHSLAAEDLQLGAILLHSGAVEEAEQLELKGVAILKELLQQTPKDVRYRATLSDLYTELGEVAKVREQFKNAAEYYQRALTLTEEMAAEDPRNALNRLNIRFKASILGELLLQVDGAQALSALRKALDRGPDAKPLPPESRIHQYFTLLNYARALWMTGDQAGAEATIRDLQGLLQAVPANKMYASGLFAHIAHLRLGVLQTDMGDFTNGLNQLQLALQTLRTHLAATPQFATSRRELSHCYDALGNYYAKLASRAGTPAEQQIAHWKEAHTWYQQNLSILQEQVQATPNDSQSARYVAQAAKNLARCDDALTNLTASRQR